MTEYDIFVPATQNDGKPVPATVEEKVKTSPNLDSRGWKDPRFGAVSTNSNQTADIGMMVDYTHRRVNTTWRGTVDLDAVAKNCRRRSEQGAHQFAQMIDAREALVAESPEDVRRLAMVAMGMAAESQKRGLAGPTAIVVGSQLDYGICRAIASYFEPAGTIRTFYDMETARAWLVTAA